jgi:hypothetical protein
MLLHSILQKDFLLKPEKLSDINDYQKRGIVFKLFLSWLKKKPLTNLIISGFFLIPKGVGPVGFEPTTPCL